MPAQTIAVNEVSLRQMQRIRQAFLGGSLDAKRPAAWDVFGYPDTITFEHMLAAYDRGGPGHGAVHRILDKCWQERPRIKRPDSDKETPFEAKAAAVLTAINGWQKLRDFDRRNMIGRYAGLIYRIADNQPLSQPLVRGTKLVDLVPVYENQLRVQAWDSDPNSENFGAVTMWQYRFRPPLTQDTQGAPDKWVDVHPSRIQILAEGSVGDFQDGVPLLKAGYNSLIDLEKIAGGSAESFLKNSARTLVLKFDANSDVAAIASNPGETAPVGSALKDAIQQKTDDLNRNIDSSIVMQGGDATTLQTTTHDPEPPFLVAANLFAASVQLPMTILFGAQTGRLASDQDQKDYIARAKSRQANELTPMLEQLVRRLQAAGLIDAGPFEVEWPDLAAPSDDEKLDRADKMERVNKSAADSGRTPMFEPDEVRKVAGYEPLTDAGMPIEGDPAADPNADPAQQPPA
jgi:uncharacterized protein